MLKRKKKTVEQTKTSIETFVWANKIAFRIHDICSHAHQAKRATSLGGLRAEGKTAKEHYKKKRLL